MANFHIHFSVAICLAVSLSLIPSLCEAEVGKLKCTVLLDITNYYEAHDLCNKKMQQKIKEKKEDNEKEKRYPYDASIESFEWDDHCHKHCVYKTVGLLSEEDTLPKQADTTTIFGKDRISDERYKKITTPWDDCLVLSEEIGKKKGWDNCKTVTHHDFCFQNKLAEITPSLQIDC